MTLPTVSPIADRKTLVQRIISEVQELLVKGALLPGDRLPPEGKLAGQFGVGRTSVREAMKVLAALGVVEVRRGDGTFVAKGNSFHLLNPLEFALILESGEARELLELRRIIDMACCDLVVQRATAEDLARLSALAEEHRVLVKAGASPQVVGAKDVEFHRAFLESTQNRPLIKVGRTIWALFVKSIVEAQDPRTVTRTSVRHHTDLVRALRSRNAEKARRIVESHLAMWYASTWQAGERPQRRPRKRPPAADGSWRRIGRNGASGQRARRK
jgi:GntR family transcriptional regulator, transcriptional repressor for pyruvate dehydrogenase complex